MNTALSILLQNPNYANTYRTISSAAHKPEATQGLFHHWQQKEEGSA